MFLGILDNNFFVCIMYISPNISEEFSLRSLLMQTNQKIRTTV